MAAFEDAKGPVYFSHFYRWLIQRLCRWRVAVCLLLLLAFGLPVFLLPEKMDGDGKWAEIYNKTLGTPTYKEKVKPIVDKALGGSLRLFVQKVYEGSYFTRNEEVVLYANANLPNGSTLEQMNTLIKRMETYLSEFKGDQAVSDIGRKRPQGIYQHSFHKGKSEKRVPIYAES